MPEKGKKLNNFFKIFAFADQILPGSGTFDLSVGPYSLSKV